MSPRIRSRCCCERTIGQKWRIDLGVVELGERGLGDHLQRLAGRIRQEVEVQPGMSVSSSPAVDKPRHKPRERSAGDNFGAPIPSPLPAHPIQQLVDMWTAIPTGWG